jgi:eukaryotic-like serine/threonine-protein kinase
MLSRLLRYFLLGLVLVLVFAVSALVAMRFAIHGREVRVPKLAGLTQAEAERIANQNGLVLSVESRFYTASLPEGRIVSQSPAPETRVRSGWKVMVAESLGAQRAAIPNLVGQSQHAAGVNVIRRGLQIGSVATLHFPGAQPGTVIAQSPPPNAKNAASPKINLIVAAADSGAQYVMPNFVGKSLDESTDLLENAGFVVGKVQAIGASPGANSSETAVAPGIIVRQHPAAGQKVTAGATVSFEVRR